MRIRAFGLSVVFSFLVFSQIYAKISFDNPVINSENKILFTVSHDSNGTVPYKTLFMADVSKAGNAKVTSKILTCFPEKMELISKGSVLQIRNRYGTARYSIPDSSLTWVTREEKLSTETRRMIPTVASPDGKWICFVKKQDASTGKLILKNLITLEEYVLDDRADFGYESVQAKWAGDGATLVYEKDNAIYFCDPKALSQKVQMSEDFRKIGKGTINSVAWANTKYLIYIDRDLVYKISANELYTRGLYAPMVGSGIVVGRLPLGFDPKRDKFWVNNSVDQIVTIKSNSVVSSYKINGTGNSLVTDSYSRPFYDVLGSAVDYDLFWSDDGSQILWVNLIGMDDGKRKSSVYRLSNQLTLLGTFDNSLKPAVSPDGRKICFGAQNALFVYDVNSWRLLGKLTGERMVSYVWNGSAIIYAGGESSVREWKMNLKGNFDDTISSVRTIFLSSVKEAFWKTSGSNAVSAQSAVNSSVFYDYDPFKNVWQKSADDSETLIQLMKKLSYNSANVQNGRFRVFSGSTPNQLFENALYVRNLIGNSTTTVIFPETTEKISSRKQVSLIFDGLDCADGLTKILYALSSYNVKATFFLNGEFIRRYPKEANQIVASGHDVASMFFTAADLTEKGYVVDGDFIKRGLARNEDEFFTATGKELALMWHAPFYKANNLIKKAGEASGYRYIECGRLALDSFTLEKAVSENAWYLSSKDLVSIYVDSAENGMVIPISVGISSGTRTDYLYEKLDILIGALLEKGYEVIPLKYLN